MLFECLSVTLSPYSFLPTKKESENSILSSVVIIFGIEVLIIPSRFLGLSKLSNVGLVSKSKLSKDLLFKSVRLSDIPSNLQKLDRPEINSQSLNACPGEGINLSILEVLNSIFVKVPSFSPRVELVGTI